MITEDDVIDVFFETVRGGAPAPACRNDPEPRSGKWGFHVERPFTPPFTPLPAGRVFLSETEIKKQLKGAGTFQIPRNAILSPLARDWLDGKGIKITYER